MRSIAATGPVTTPRAEGVCIASPAGTPPAGPRDRWIGGARRGDEAWAPHPGRALRAGRETGPLLPLNGFQYSQLLTPLAFVDGEKLSTVEMTDKSFRLETAAGDSWRMNQQHGSDSAPHSAQASTQAASERTVERALGRR